MISHILFDFFGTLVSYAPHGPDHDFGRSHKLLRSLGSPVEYQEYLTLWAAIGNRMNQEADRTGREFTMLELSAVFLRQALDREPAEGEADTMARAYLADWDTCVGYLPGASEDARRAERPLPGRDCQQHQRHRADTYGMSLGNC